MANRSQQVSLAENVLALVIFLGHDKRGKRLLRHFKQALILQLELANSVNWYLWCFNLNLVHFANFLISRNKIAIIIGLFVFRQEQHTFALFTGTSGSSGSMDEKLGVARRVELNDEVDAG